MSITFHVFLDPQRWRTKLTNTEKLHNIEISNPLHQLIYCVNESTHQLTTAICFPVVNSCTLVFSHGCVKEPRALGHRKKSSIKKLLGKVLILL